MYLCRLRLRKETLACIDEQHSELRCRGCCRHVARVLLMPRRVSDDETPPPGGKVAIGDVDGNALFTLRFQTIDQQCEIELTRRRASKRDGSLPSAASWSS